MKQHKPIYIPVYNIAVLITICRFWINVVKFTQTLVEIWPSNASQGQHRRKDATEQMKNLTLARTRIQVPGFSSAGDLGSSPSECQIFHVFRCVLSSMLPLRSDRRSNFDKGLHILTTTLIKKRHIIIRTAILYNEINSGQIMKKTLSNNMSRKVHMKGRQRSEFKIWKLIRIKIQVLPLAPVA